MRKLLLSSVVGVALMISVEASAQGVPTFDAQNVAQNIKQLQQMLDDMGIQNDQLDQLLSQVKTLESQLAEAKKLYSSLTGARDIIGSVMEGDVNALLDGSLTDVIGAFSGIAKGDFSALTSGKSPNMRKTMDQVLASAGFAPGKVQELSSSNVPGAKRVAAQASTGAVVAAQGEQSHKEAGQSLQRVDKLVAMIPEMKDTKASIDLNTRVTAEMAISLAKLVELESVVATSTGMTNAMTAGGMAEDRAFMTFAAP